MKYTKEQIISKAKKIIKDIDGEFYTDNSINNAIFEKNEEVTFGKNSGKKIPCWIVSIHSLFDNLDFLTISDETGEPLYYQNFNTFIFEVEKDKEGNFSLLWDL